MIPFAGLVVVTEDAESVYDEGKAIFVCMLRTNQGLRNFPYDDLGIGGVCVGNAGPGEQSGLHAAECDIFSGVMSMPPTRRR